MISTRHQRLFVAGAVLLAAVGCQEKEAYKPPAAKPTPFEEALMLGEIYPMADGTAYLASLRGALFYVNGDTAEMVTGVPTESFGELTALADGTALYLLSFDDSPKLFRLRGATASPVVEGDSKAETQPSAMPEGFFFAENQRLKKELEELSSELAALEEPAEPYYEREPY